MVNKVIAAVILIALLIIGLRVKSTAIDTVANKSSAVTEKAIQNDLKNLNDFTTIFSGDYFGRVLPAPAEDSHSDSIPEYGDNLGSAPREESSDSTDTEYMGYFEYPTETKDYGEDAK